MENNANLKTIFKLYNTSIIISCLFVCLLKQSQIINTIFSKSNDILNSSIYNINNSIIKLKVILGILILTNLLVLFKTIFQDYLKQKTYIVICLVQNIVFILFWNSILYFYYSFLSLTGYSIILLVSCYFICMLVILINQLIDFKEFIRVNYSENIEKSD